MYYFMKRIAYLRALVIAAVLAVAMPMSAQFLRTGYFMEGSSRMQLNPANLPSRGYLDAPALGTLNVGAYTNSLGLQDLINTFDSDGDFYDNPDFYNKLKVANDLGISLSTDIISFGFYRGKNFWSANVGVRFDLEAGIPRNMFDYLRDSPDGDMDNLSSWNNQNYQISNLRLALNSFAEVGVGYARIINDRLTVGGKFNVLLGMGNLDMKINNVQISTTELYDRYGNIDPNANATIDVDASLEANMKGLELTTDDYSGAIDGVEMNGFGIGGYGVGIDLGATYRLLNNLTLSAAVTDLGFISWSKSSSSVVEGDNTQTYDASNMDQFMDRVDGGEVIDFDMFGLQKGNVQKKRSTRLPTTLAVGAEYAFWKNRFSVGGLYTSRWGMNRTLSEVTLSANFRPTTKIGLSASYSMLQSAGKTFGAAIKLGPLTLGTDYLFLGKNTRSVNVFLGLSRTIGKKRPEVD